MRKLILFIADLFLVFIILFAAVKKTDAQEVDYLKLAEEAIEEEEYDAALNAFQRYLEDEPKDIDVHLSMGALYEKTGMMERALESYEEALAIETENPAVLGRLGNWYLKENDRESSFAIFEEVIARNDTAVYNRLESGKNYLFEMKYSLANEKFQFVVETCEALITAHEKLGVIYGDSGMVTEAIESYQTSIERNKILGEGYAGLSEASFRLNMTNEAIELCLKALTFDPENAQIHFVLGMAYQAEERLSEAAEEFEKTYNLQPQRAEAHYLRGVCFDQQENLAYAIEEYRRAIRVNPSYGDALYALSKSYFRNIQYQSAWDQVKILRNLGFYVSQEFTDRLTAALPEPEE